METNLKYPISLEFYGLPGCGKSTVSHKLADELRTDGWNVWEPSYDIDRKYIPIIRKIVKLWKLFGFAIKNYELYTNICSLVKKNGYKGKDAMSHRINIALKVLSYLNCKEYDIIIWDEGVTQAAISLSFNSSCSILENERSINGLIGDIRCLKIYVYVDIQTAMNRMELRYTCDSRVEKMKTVEYKHFFLNNFLKNCETVFFDCLNREKECLQLDSMAETIYEMVRTSRFAVKNMLKSVNN